MGLSVRPPAGWSDVLFMEIAPGPCDVIFLLIAPGGYLTKLSLSPLYHLSPLSVGSFPS